MSEDVAVVLAKVVAALLVCSLITLIAFKARLERRERERSDQRFFHSIERLGPPPAVFEPPWARRRSVFVWAHATNLVLALLPAHLLELQWMARCLLVLAVGLAGIALSLHRSASAAPDARYEAMAVAVVLSWSSIFRAASGGGDASGQRALLLLLQIGLPLALDRGTGALVSRVARNSSEDLCFLRAALLRRAVTRLVPLLMLGAALTVGLLAPLLLVVLRVRYETSALLARRPILFLRSFASAESALVYGKIIGPVASRWGTPVALVTVSQGPAALGAHADSHHQARVLAVEDVRWQDWVNHFLSVAGAVVIDTTLETPGLLWEVRRAAEVMEPARVLHLRARRPVRIDAVSPAVLDFGVGLLDRRRSRRLLNRWFARCYRSAVAHSGRPGTGPGQDR